jgi:hypothetical protein
MKRVSYFTKTAIIYAIIGLAIISGFLSPYVWTFHGGLSSDHLAWGSFGSYLGSILGPLFSGFAFILLLYTVHLQRKHDQVSDLYHALDTMAKKLDELRDDPNWKILLNNARRNPETAEKIPWHFAWNEMKTVIVHMADALEKLESVSPASKTGAFYKGVYSGFVSELTRWRALRAEDLRMFETNAR